MYLKYAYFSNTLEIGSHDNSTSVSVVLVVVRGARSSAPGQGAAVPLRQQAVDHSTEYALVQRLLLQHHCRRSEGEDEQAGRCAVYSILL